MMLLDIVDFYLPVTDPDNARHLPVLIPAMIAYLTEGDIPDYRSHEIIANLWPSLILDLDELIGEGVLESLCRRPGHQVPRDGPLRPIRLPLKGHRTFSFPPSRIRCWEARFPQVDVPQALEDMRSYLRHRSDRCPDSRTLAILVESCLQVRQAFQGNRC